jgi:hypothetical protein
VVCNICLFTIGFLIDDCDKFQILTFWDWTFAADYVSAVLVVQLHTELIRHEQSQATERNHGQCSGGFINLGTLLNLKRSKVRQEFSLSCNPCGSQLRCSDPIWLPW